jgi:protoheme IX farnesyltransferase
LDDSPRTLFQAAAPFVSVYLPALPRLKMDLGALVVLFKLRVVVLLLLAALGGALLATGGHISAGSLVLLLVTGTLSSAGASAVNQYLERSRDARMERTCHRPLAAGQLARPELVLGVSVGLILLAVVIALPFSWSLALFLALGALIYVGIYTLWLKPRTLLNIVVGGTAGSCAVLSGSAAAGNWAHPTAVGLALLVFAWTPIHFWSLAHAYRDDYAHASVPMLPVVADNRTSAWWIALHTGATAWITLLLGVNPALGLPYWLLAIPATLWLGFHSVRLIAVPDQTQALRLFKVSNMYLGLVLLAICAGMLF